jgi:tripeptide aminopeptidase
VSPQASARDLAAVVLRRTTELAVIPAPPGAEQRRAALVRDWWEQDGWAPRTDAAGNVWAQVTGGDGDGLLVCAHLDTVFAADAPHEVRAEPGRLAGPSVGDDSIGVAALSALASLVRADRGSRPFWIVATVGEEGMGNLAGIRHALAHPPGPLAAVIAIEGNYLGRVVTTGVGSVRLRAHYHGPGGHAWERADAPSAVHAAARAVSALAGLPVVPGPVVPAGPVVSAGPVVPAGAAPGARCSVNIGLIGGGEAINARARDAWFEVDLRADSMSALQQLEDRAMNIISAAATGLRVDTTDLGRRPAGGISPASPLARAAQAALEAAGIECEFGASSTDANAAHAAGIPAVALGVTRGAGEHTPQEWIETAGVPAGLAALAATIESVREDRRDLS